MIHKIASLYIATVIGAGFASGREIVEFFARFGSWGLVGILIATMILSKYGGKALGKCVQLNVVNYQELIEKLSKTAVPIIDLLYTVFLLLGTSIMFSGAGEAIQRLTGIPGGMHFTALLVFIAIIKGSKTVLAINGYLVPVMIVMMGYISIATVIRGQLSLPPGNLLAIPYGVLYGAYNYGFSLAVFAGVSRVVKNKHEAGWGGVVGGLVLGAIIFLVVLALYSVPGQVLNMSMPMLELAYLISPTAAILYTVVIWMAMYTTALSHAVAVTQRIYRYCGNRQWVAVLLVLLITLLIARVGFAPLITVTYPAFGVIGFFLLWRMLRL